MRSANLLTTLIGRRTAMLAGMLLLALPAAAAPMTASAPIIPSALSDADLAFNAAPAAFSLTPVESRPYLARRTAHRRSPQRHFRLFGYPSANADELSLPPPAVPAPALLFSHAALGVAVLDASSANAGETAIAAGHSGDLTTALDRTIPAERKPILPSPLPISLIMALVLLPTALVLGQALHGPSRRPRPAMRPRSALRRDFKG